MDSIEAAVIGGGVVGLAVGRALAMQGMPTLVFEREVFEYPAGGRRDPSRMRRQA